MGSSHLPGYVPICVLLVLASATGLSGQEAPDRVAVLDTAGVWRLHQTFAPPVIESDDGVSPLLFNRTWLERETAPAADGWMTPGFDDSGWLRGPAGIAAESPYLSRLCMRGEFLVTDPGKVRDLALTVGCHGGVIVYVNGREIVRRHLPAKIDDREKVLADGYPAEVFVDENGGNLGAPSGRPPSAESVRRAALRTRVIPNVSIPTGLLRKGVNVVAIEVIRAPYGRVMETFRDVFNHPSIRRMLQTKELRTFVELKWPTCAIRHVRLSASGGEGLVPNAVRPGGFHVWNVDVMASDFDLDFGSATRTLRPVRIAGTRNGSFSGKVMAGSREAIRGLRVDVSDLRGPQTIPASAVRIRFGIPWGETAGASSLYPVKPVLLGALAEGPPAEIRVREAPTTRGTRPTSDVLAPVFGAVTSIWITTDVPADAKPGRYAGELTIRADGEKPVRVPVVLDVADWKLPDPQDYSTWVELIQSPDTLVEEYGLERWSDAHFEMIARSMKHLNRIGSRVVYVPVICHTNLGNEESMVRWVRKPDGTFDWDFSVMERYLDTVEQHMGRPKVVCFWVWEKFMFPSVENPATYEYDRPTVRTNDNPRGTNDDIREYIGKGPRVTVLDPATRKVSKEFLPYLLAPRSKAIWKPLFVALRKQLGKRGLLDAMMLGTPSDVTLRKEHFAFFNEVAPGVPWVSHSHMLHNRIFEAGGARLGYYSTVFNVVFALDPDEGRRHGWQKPELHAHLLRNWDLNTDDMPLTTWRHMTELNIAGSQRGIGHLGADFWSVVKNSRRSRVGRIYEKYPEGNWRSNDICTAVLAPGPDGPVATDRYEMLREGVQECEARIFIERALVDETLRAKLGDDLAKRCQETLDERTRAMIRGISSLQLTGYWRQLAPLATHGSGGWWNVPGIAGNTWFVASGWQDRTLRLFALAGEVADRLGTGAAAR
ncbi:MAG TPA: glycoside hydrolase domain-containing protein [Planctomycetota bacterium]|nr:glycoside hydrolase domain-containing protein [Planctomycetota bacterium]